MSGRSRTVLCHQNIEIADFLTIKLGEIAADGNSIFAKSIERALTSVCEHPMPITTAKEALQVKNVGTKLLKLMAHIFEERNSTPASQPGLGESVGANGKAKRKYCPKKNTAPYALLITLLRGCRFGKQFMRKQELIDETDKSGLSNKPIKANAVGWAGANGGQTNHKDFYSGWTSMATLTKHGLVAKSSNPAKYMLTGEGIAVAKECLVKSGLSLTNNIVPEVVRQEEPRGIPAPQASSESGSPPSQESSSSDEDIQEIRRSDVRQKNNAHFSNSQPGPSKSNPAKNKSPQPPPAASRREASARPDKVVRPTNKTGPHPVSAINVSSVLGSRIAEIGSVDLDFKLAVPPLEPGQKFADVYEVICVLDNREKFRGRMGNSSSVSELKKFVEGLRTQFKVKVETKMSPVGDALWIARHRRLNEEYVLDFVVERKNVHDLWSSLQDGRYKQQKLRLKNCGLRGLIYLVEGDVNAVQTTDSLRTAMFTTELQGFRLLRTDDPAHTLREYGHLTNAIISRYNMETGQSRKSSLISMTYNAFVEACKAFKKDRVSDIFCRQLTQINQVTEDVARSIQDRYPTLLSISQAFRNLEGDQLSQEKMLQGIPIRNSTSRTISAVMSTNVYKAIWSPVVHSKP